MKRYFLTACAIATGFLAMSSTSAFAQTALPQVAVTDGGTVSVPFVTATPGILPSCLAVPTPGVLVQDDKTLTSAGSVAGQILLTCTVGTDLSAGVPVQSTTVLAGIAGPTTFSSGTAFLSDEDLPAGINTVDVDMEATTIDPVIAAGVYAFTVPVTVTYK